jgi:dTDP-4-dehydrorhamnose reductase
MRILVTGSKGMLGTDLCRIFSEEHEVLATDIEEMDVRDYKKVRRTINGFKPDVVILGRPD